MVRRAKRGATRKPVRKELQAREWQSILQNSAVAFVLIAVAAVAMYVYKNDTLPIVHVTVEGEFVHVDKDALVTAVSPYTRGSFISVDVASIRAAGEALPWVRKIQVRRIWPDSLHLIVEEQAVIARWGKAGLVSGQGETFFPDQQTLPANMTVLIGPDSSHKVVTQRYQQMRKALSDIDLTVKTLTMDERRAWSIGLDNGMKVVLGRADSEQRFQRFIQAYRSGLHHYQLQIAIMDMRYTNGLAVSWKPGQKPDFNGKV